MTITCIATHQFSHHAVEFGALCDTMAMAAMVARHVVVVAQDRPDGRCDRLFADI